MAWNPPDPEPEEPTLCDQMRGDCRHCPQRIPCGMPDPPELDLEGLDPDLIEVWISESEEANDDGGYQADTAHAARHGRG